MLLLSYQGSVLSLFMDTDQITAWLPSCFQAGQGFMEMFDCLNVTSECFGIDSVQDIINCTVSNDLLLGNIVNGLGGANASLESLWNNSLELLLGGGDLDQILNATGFDVTTFLNSSRSCLDPYIPCVNATIQGLVQEINPCIEQSLDKMTTCALDNFDVCLEPCSNSSMTLISSTASQLLSGGNNNIFNFDLSTLFTCDGIQNTIMDPMCDVLTCCEPCVEPFEELMECIVNNVIDLTESDCLFQCTVAERHRELASPHDDIRSAMQPEVSKSASSSLRRASRRQMNEYNTTISNSCLQFAPGLTGNSVEELAARTPIFLPCVYDEFYNVMGDEQQKQQSTSANNNTNEENGSGMNTSSVSTGSTSDAYHFKKGGIGSIGSIAAALFTAIFSLIM